MNEVKKTTNYSMFKTLKGNRPISEPHVRRLMLAFENAYLVSPILINSKFEIIDGQHRLEAAKRLGLPVYYFEFNGYGLKEIQTINSNNRTWGRMEYLNSYCELGLKPYLQLKEFMKQYPEFGISASEVILSNLTGGPNVKQAHEKKIRIHPFESGDFKIHDLQLAYENAAKIMGYKEFYDGFARALFVRVMIGLFKNPKFDNTEMIRKLKSQPTSLVHCTNVEQYKLLFEKIYNYRIKHKVNLRY